jgi:hypothetical protein
MAVAPVPSMAALSVNFRRPISAAQLLLHFRHRGTGHQTRDAAQEHRRQYVEEISLFFLFDHQHQLSADCRHLVCPAELC